VCAALIVPFETNRSIQDEQSGNRKNDYIISKAVLHFTENITVVGLDEEY
jgi:hypothetical protein